MEENKAKRLDLSKLKVLELPHEDVEVEIAGEKQLVTVHALGGRGQSALDGLALNRGSVTNSEKLDVIALVYGADLSEKDAENFIECEYSAASIVIAKVFDLTHTLIQNIKNESEEAKKKSDQAVSVSETATQG